MGAEVIRTISSIVAAIIGLAILSVLLSKQSTTLGLVQNLSSGLAQDIKAATSPITSAGGLGDLGNNTYSFASS